MVTGIPIREVGGAKPTGASKVIIEAIREKTAEKSEDEIKRLLKGFVVTLGIVALLLILFGVVMQFDAKSIVTEQSSK